MFFLLFAFSKLNANNLFHSLKASKDSLNVTDTVLISTEHYDETTIYLIDSICKRHEEILQKMPMPIFVPPQGGKMNYLGNDTYAIEYDSINKLIVNAVKLFFRSVENKQLQPELIHRPKTQPPLYIKLCVKS